MAWSATMDRFSSSLWFLTFRLSHQNKIHRLILSHSNRLTSALTKNQRNFLPLILNHKETCHFFYYNFITCLYFHSVALALLRTLLPSHFLWPVLVKLRCLPFSGVTFSQKCQGRLSRFFLFENSRMKWRQESTWLPRARRKVKLNC